MRDVKREEIPTDVNCEKCGKHDGHQVGEDGPLPRLLRLPRLQEHQGLQGGRRQDRPRGGGDHRRDLREVRQAHGHQARPLRAVHGVLRATRSARPASRISIGVACPTCKVGYLTERRTRRGKIFFGCNRYPDCTFAAWDRPLAEACPQCALAVPAAEVLQARRRPYIACPNKECDYQRDRWRRAGPWRSQREGEAWGLPSRSRRRSATGRRRLECGGGSAGCLRVARRSRLRIGSGRVPTRGGPAPSRHIARHPIGWRKPVDKFPQCLRREAPLRRAPLNVACRPGRFLPESLTAPATRQPRARRRKDSPPSMSTSVSYLIEVVLAAAPGAKGGAVDSIVRFFKDGGPFMYVNIFWLACAIAVIVERIVTLMFRYNLNAAAVHGADHQAGADRQRRPRGEALRRGAQLAAGEGHPRRAHPGQPRRDRGRQGRGGGASLENTPHDPDAHPLAVVARQHRDPGRPHRHHHRPHRHLPVAGQRAGGPEAGACSRTASRRR